MRKIAKRLNASHTTIKNHVKRLGLFKKLYIWIPYELKKIHLTQRINICDMQFNVKQSILFLKRLSLAMKYGWSIITLFEEDHGPSMMNQHKTYRKLNYMRRRSGCQFGGIIKVLCILRRAQKTERSTQMFIAYHL